MKPQSGMKSVSPTKTTAREGFAREVQLRLQPELST
jgi:hypothetical protein